LCFHNPPKKYGGSENKKLEKLGVVEDQKRKGKKRRKKQKIKK